MEIWKDIPWYEWKYQVSNLGNVNSLKRLDSNNHLIQEKILKQSNSNWYLIVRLCKNWKWINQRVHRLVLFSFIWNSKKIINHIDWNKLNNNLQNLEYCTYSHNNKEAYRIWLKQWYWKDKFWENNHSSKKVNQYDLQWNYIKTWGSFQEIERELKICHQNIIKCCQKKVWYKTAWWYKWEYFNN